MTPEQAKAILAEFAQTFDGLIGSDEFVIMLKFLIDFAKNNPTVVLELKEEVIKDPAAFLDIIHPESIMKFKSIIQAVKTGGIEALLSEFI